MELKDFKIEKRLIASRLRMNLKVAQERGTTEFKYCYGTTYKQITIRHDEKHEAIAGKMKYVSGLIGNGTPYKIETMTEKPYCTTTYVGTSYTFTILTIREEITDRQIESHMKEFVKRKILLHLATNWLTVDCRVMELYKTGKIVWADVIEAHTIDCSF